MSVFDYIRETNALSVELLRSHGDLLGRKNIWRKQDFIQVIKLDLDRLAHALLEVKENRAAAVLANFFCDTSVDPEEICGRLSDPYIYHVGFEILEPLDLVLYGIQHWIEHSQRTLGAHMRVKNFQRFPASPAFQGRVGAYAEIMRIWLEVNDRALMLELFDIYRPADAVRAARAPKLTHRNFHGLFQDGIAPNGHRERVAGLFDGDEIWHYALYVKQPEDVLQFHAEWQKLAEGNAQYALAYTAPVYNPHDRSFHTKIVRRASSEGARLELEFVTQVEGSMSPSI